MVKKTTSTQGSYKLWFPDFRHSPCPTGSVCLCGLVDHLHDTTAAFGALTFFLPFLVFLAVCGITKSSSWSWCGPSEAAVNFLGSSISLRHIQPSWSGYLYVHDLVKSILLYSLYTPYVFYLLPSGCKPNELPTPLLEVYGTIAIAVLGI